MNKNGTNKSQVFFGVRVVLLALAILLLSGSVIYSYIKGMTLTAFDLGLRGAAIACTASVMFFEIKNYRQLYSKGVREIYREKDVELDKLDKFRRLVTKNEFRYNFQPIVNAMNGDIFAYEVLMRTSDDIGLKPLEVLKYAEISNMLYNVERSTFFNALKYYKDNIELFGNKKIFINSIPSVILPDSELKKLKDMYSDISDNIVVEILENDDDDDDSIAAFDNLRNILNCNIAVDDYGSGYSNDMKVLNNNPNFIKIDMSLITSIDTDSKKQLLVSNLIKFGKKYNIMILAEGVETKEELSKVIELGVDLIQGFYTAKPSNVVVSEIDSEIAEYIIEENVRLSKYDNMKRIYTASDGEIVNVFNLSLKKYAGVFVPEGTVHFVGTKNHIVDMIIKAADDKDIKLVFENVNIKGAVETTVQIGENSNTEIELIGDNTFNKEGIHVPPTSKLTVTGSGSLTVKNNRNSGCGIGSSYEKPYGDITINTEGVITVDSSGDKVVCIGGGEKATGARISILGGKVNVMGRGIYAVGIGSASGDTDILIEKGTVISQCIANEAVSLGTMYGSVDITSSGSLDLLTDGERITGIGVLNGGSGHVAFKGGDATSVIHGDIGSAIGSVGGTVSVICEGGRVHAHSEGTRVCGIGASDAGGLVHISGGTVTVGIKSAEPSWIGNSENKPIITGGNVILENNGSIDPVNTDNEPLVLYRMDRSDSYSENITTPAGSYTYRAQRDEISGMLCVYVPERVRENIAQKLALEAEAVEAADMVERG